MNNQLSVRPSISYLCFIDALSAAGHYGPLPLKPLAATAAANSDAIIESR